MKKSTTTTTTFTDLLRKYESATRNRSIDETFFTTALTDLATACTYSVLKKLCNVGGTVTEKTKNVSDSAKTVRVLRQSIATDTNNLKRLEYAVNNSTKLCYNQNGEKTTVVTDKELHESVTTLIDYCLNDGIDLVHTAVQTILSETQKIVDLSCEFMEKPYDVRRLKKKVYIQDVSSLGGYETVETTPIQEVYKAIRRDIEKSRAMQTANSKYTYISDILRDTESETETEIYRRLSKYSGLAYETTDINGKVTAITADDNTVEEIDRLIGALNLTAKQAKILQLRLSGYGYKAIGTYLGVTDKAVKNNLKCIQKKAVESGIFPIK